MNQQYLIIIILFFRLDRISVTPAAVPAVLAAVVAVEPVMMIAPFLMIAAPEMILPVVIAR